MAKKEATKLKTSVSKMKAPTRKGAKASTSWNVPAKAVKSGAKDDVRFDGLQIDWIYDAKPSTKGHKKSKGDVLDRDTTGKEKTKSDSDTFDRKKFHPYKGKPVLLYIECWVRGYNDQTVGKKTERVYGPWAHKALKLAAPDAPSITLTYSSSNGRVTAQYETEHPDGAKECLRTKCWVRVGSDKKVDGTTYTDESKTVGAWEVPSALNLGIGKYVSCHFVAQNQGLRGDSAKAEKTVYVVHPNPGTLGEPAIVYATKGVKETAMVRVPVTSTGRVKVGEDSKKQAIWQYPTTITLQRLKGVPTDNDPVSASQMEGWTDVMSDNGVTNGLSDTWAQGVSDVGLHTWYRLKSERDGYTVLSMPVCAKALDVSQSSTVAGAANIDSLVPGADGKSLVAVLSGKESDDDGYEVSWSDDADAWESTSPPKTFETASNRLVIKGLTEGTRYYVKARAYDTDADGNHIYGKYSGVRDETPYTTPTTVVLSGDATTARGSALQLSWTYDTEAPQTRWRLVRPDGSVLVEREESTCAYAVAPEEYGDASSITLRLEMTTGGGWARSIERTFSFADAPTCSLSVPSVLTTQPLSLTVASDTGDSVSVSVTASGSTGPGIGGTGDQAEGDTVWSGSSEPAWSGTGQERAATVELPGGQAFHNHAAYTVRASVTDAATGLSSEPVEAPFTVEWAHTASQPTVTVTADQAARSAEIAVTAPADYQKGDRFDLYRSTPDGERLIASDVPYGSTVTDRLAPFSSRGENLSYVAVAKTADGDTCASDDAAYSIACRSLRFDWADKFVELPYNFAASDSFEKDSEVRGHVDGTRTAHWNGAVSRSANLSTAVVKFRDAEQQEAVRDMLQHAGSVFVRTPDGLAFAADVRTGTVERSYDSKEVGMSFDAVEHDLGDAGRPRESDIRAPEWGGGAVEVVNGTVYDTAGGYPLDAWSFIGHVSGVLHVYDGGSVRIGTGAAKAGWTWDGDVLLDAGGNAVALDEEA